MNNKKDIKFTALLDEKLYEKLRLVAYKNHVSISMIIRKAVAEFLLRDDLDEFFKKIEQNKQ